jgi:hypothetical protein
VTSSRNSLAAATANRVVRADLRSPQVPHAMRERVRDCAAKSPAHRSLVTAFRALPSRRRRSPVPWRGGTRSGHLWDPGRTMRQRPRQQFEILQTCRRLHFSVANSNSKEHRVIPERAISVNVFSVARPAHVVSGDGLGPFGPSPGGEIEKHQLMPAWPQGCGASPIG